MKALGRGLVLVSACLALALGGPPHASTGRPPGSGNASWDFGALDPTAGGGYGEIGLLLKDPLDRSRFLYVDETHRSHLTPASGPIERPQQLFVSRPTQRIRSADTVRGARPGQAFLVLLHEDSVRVVELGQHVDRNRFQVPVSSYEYLLAVAAADLEGDPRPEIAVLSNQRLRVYGLDGPELWSLEGVGGYVLGIGQVDMDSGAEIVTGSGAVVDALSHTVQSQLPLTALQHLLVADLDFDEVEEILAPDGPDVLYFDGATGAQVGGIERGPYAGGIGPLAVLPGDGVGAPRVVLGGHPWLPAIEIRDSVDGDLLASIGTDSTISSLLPMDYLPGGDREVLWSMGHRTTARDLVGVLNTQNVAKSWVLEDAHDGFIGPVWADLDGDGDPELAAGVAGSVTWGPRLFVFSGDRLELLGATEDEVLPVPLDLRARDLDGDGRFELLVGGAFGYYGGARAYSFDPASGFTQVWKTALPTSTPIYSVEAGDLDGDGRLEIVTESRRTSLAPFTISVFDGRSGKELWYTQLPQAALNYDRTQIEIVDLDSDGVLEIACLGSNGTLYVVDSETHLVELVHDGGFTAISTPVPTLSQAVRTSTWLADPAGAIRRYAVQDGALVVLETLAFPGGATSIVEDDLGLWLASAGDAYFVPFDGNPVRLSLGYDLGGFGRRVIPLSGGSRSAAGATYLAVRAFD